MSKSKILSALSSFTDQFSERIDGLFARKSDLTAHTGNADVHMTAEERSKLNDVNNKLHDHSNKTVLDNTTASFSSEEQAKLSGIATGAEVNVIDAIKVNGTALTPDSSKAVDILIDSVSGYGTCDTAAATVEKVVTIVDNPNWVLKTGSRIMVKFSATNTASGPTLNVNNTGAKPIIHNGNIMTGAGTAAGVANRCIEYVYDGTGYVFIGWSFITTYNPQTLGSGYGTCSTAAATTAKVVTLSGYILTTNGYVAVKFTNAVPANATMNINNRGAKAIYHRGAAIKAGIINAGDIAHFVYNGSQYILLSTDGAIELATDSDIDAIIAGTYS